jgi:hypothetical protein
VGLSGGDLFHDGLFDDVRKQLDGLLEEAIRIPGRSATAVVVVSVPCAMTSCLPTVSHVEYVMVLNTSTSFKPGIDLRMIFESIIQ